MLEQNPQNIFFGRTNIRRSKADVLELSFNIRCKYIKKMYDMVIALLNAEKLGITLAGMLALSGHHITVCSAFPEEISFINDIDAIV